MNSNNRAKRTSRWGAVSAAVGVVGLLAEGLLFWCSTKGIAPKIINFDFIVRMFVVVGGVAVLGTVAAMISLARSGRREWRAWLGLAVNAFLATVGACFTILLPK